MKYPAAFLGLVLIVFSCSHGKKEPDIIPREKMVRILAETVMAKEIFVRHQKRFDADSVHPVKSLLQSFGTDSATFYSSLRYYAVNPEDFAMLYREVEQIIKQKKDSLDKTVKVKRKVPAPLKKDTLPFPGGRLKK